VTDAAPLIVADLSRLVVRVWQDRAVCYDTASGDTIFLDEVGTAILGHLGAGPVDLKTLLSWLDDQLEPGSDPVDLSMQALARLRDLGLISESPV
jgi:PqqD family protein of HPr-rel-A system